MGFDVFLGKLKGQTDLEMLDRIITSRKLQPLRYLIIRLLNIYHKIFGTCSYGGGALTS